MLPQSFLGCLRPQNLLFFSVLSSHLNQVNFTELVKNSAKWEALGFSPGLFLRNIRSGRLRAFASAGLES
ncbi:hypothetical protein Nepgr_008503 [Nepenthes gracilis]|uniref:Uncharacterized protein n=1 Tax=Nepenthes gracilis TaxID=150966 RepID=A0AAD3S8U0_NEPGR|nr:hypothetical protein Nepgr_008503 [Nepenthes gracilis]